MNGQIPKIPKIQQPKLPNLQKPQKPQTYSDYLVQSAGDYYNKKNASTGINYNSNSNTFGGINYNNNGMNYNNGVNYTNAGLNNTPNISSFKNNVPIKPITQQQNYMRPSELIPRYDPTKPVQYTKGQTIPDNYQVTPGYDPNKGSNGVYGRFFASRGYPPVQPESPVPKGYGDYLVREYKKYHGITDEPQTTQTATQYNTPGYDPEKGTNGAYGRYFAAMGYPPLPESNVPKGYGDYLVREYKKYYGIEDTPQTVNNINTTPIASQPTTMQAAKANVARANAQTFQNAEIEQSNKSPEEQQLENMNKQLEIERQRALNEAQNAFETSKSTYGKKAEELAQMGLTGSGYGEYLITQAYAQNQIDKKDIEAYILKQKQQNEQNYQENLVQKTQNSKNALLQLMGEMDSGVLNMSKEQLELMKDMGLTDEDYNKAMQYYEKAVNREIDSAIRDVTKGSVENNATEYEKAQDLYELGKISENDYKRITENYYKNYVTNKLNSIKKGDDYADLLYEIELAKDLLSTKDYEKYKNDIDKHIKGVREYGATSPTKESITYNVVEKHTGKQLTNSSLTLGEYCTVTASNGNSVNVYLHLYAGKQAVKEMEASKVGIGQIYKASDGNYYLRGKNSYFKLGDKTGKKAGKVLGI